MKLETLKKHIDEIFHQSGVMVTSRVDHDGDVVVLDDGKEISFEISLDADPEHGFSFDITAFKSDAGTYWEPPSCDDCDESNVDHLYDLPEVIVGMRIKHGTIIFEPDDHK